MKWAHTEPYKGRGRGSSAYRPYCPLVKNPAYGPEHTRTRYQRYFRHDVIYTSYTVDVDVDADEFRFATLLKLPQLL
jgi:hypothetical protein